MRLRRWLGAGVSLAVAVGMAGFGDISLAAQEEENALSGTQQAVIETFDWGAGLTKTILTLDAVVTPDSVGAEKFLVHETKESFNWAALSDETMDASEHILAEADRTVMAAYVSDAEGNKLDVAGNRITLELYCDPSEGGVLCFDLLTMKNTICAPYELSVTLAEDAVLETEDGLSITSLDVAEEILLSEALIPQLHGVDLSGVFTGSDGRTLTYASFAPQDDGQGHPLVIWLHGAGEGGTDASLPFLGAKPALFGEEFQAVMGGAYILSPQTPEFWLCYNDNLDWQDNPGTDSIYLDTLMELIESYVKANPAIDTDRIYVGGCSNGGYMTMDLVLNNPDYFAAAFPICEAYRDAGLTDEELSGILDLPIWFVYAENDTTVYPPEYEIPTVARLKAAGADVHTSVFPGVYDTSGLYTKEDGSVYEYNGHWSWVYFFNNECEENGVSLWQWLAYQERAN